MGYFVDYVDCSNTAHYCCLVFVDICYYSLHSSNNNLHIVDDQIHYNPYYDDVDNINDCNDNNTDVEV